MSIAYNEVVKEYLKESVYDGEIQSKTADQETGEIKSITEAAIGEIGQALQALYEMPLASYIPENEKAKYGENAKDYLGILVERVEKAKEYWLENESSSNKLQAGNSETESYTPIEYTEDEAKSIANFMDKIIDNKGLSQNIIASVGLLFQAAAETQKRLMNIESSVYGFDSKTLPGDRDDFNKDTSKVAEELKDIVTSTPLLLGLNRLVKALCFEVFNTYEFDSILAEQDDTNPNSEDGNKGKVSILSRLDLIDKNIQFTRDNAKWFFEWYMANHFNKYLNRLTTEVEGDEANWATQLPKLEDYQTLSKYNEVPQTDFEAPEKDIIQVPSLIEEGEDKGFFNTEDGKLQTEDKEVYWIDEKVERLNMKLSKVVRDLYGVDSVLEEVPNRIETLNQNVLNLANALYYNDDVSNKDYKNGLIDHYNAKFDESNPLTPITWALANEIYNWSVNQKITGDLLAKYNEGSQSTEVSSGSVKFKNVSPTTKKNGKAYGDGYTPIDLIIDHLGDTSYYSQLFEPGTYNGLLSSLDSYAQSSNIASTQGLSNLYNDVFLKEILYKVYGDSWDNQDSDKITIKSSTSLPAYVSRKEKTLESRIVTLEAFGDTLARTMSKYNGSGTMFKHSSNQAYRFEEFANTAFDTLANEIKDLSWFNENMHLPHPILAAIKDQEVFRALVSTRYTLDSMSFKVVDDDSNQTLAETLFKDAKTQISAKNDELPEAQRARILAAAVYAPENADLKKIALVYGNNLDKVEDIDAFSNYIVVFNDLQASNGIQSTKATKADTENNIKTPSQITFDNLVDEIFKVLDLDTQAYEPRDILFDEKLNKAIVLAGRVYHSIERAINGTGGLNDRISALENEIGGTSEKDETQTLQKANSRIDELTEKYENLLEDHKELIEKFNDLVSVLYDEEGNGYKKNEYTEA